jgi:alcohol dehydrogenase YqhD (iron-dependent ADH family)
MEYVLSEETTDTFVEYAQNVWQVNGKSNLTVARKGIEKTREFFTHLGMPKTLRDVGVQENKLEGIAEKTVLYGEIGKFKKLGKNDVLVILKNAF